MDEKVIDSIFSGSLKSLPPVSSKIVRIFTSSTFTDKNVCNNINFDRTRYLDGYPIKASLPIFHRSTQFVYKNAKKKNLNAEDQVYVSFLQLLQFELNITLLLQPYKLNWSDIERLYDGLYEEKYDVAFTQIPMHSIINFTPVYPLHAIDLSILSFERGYYTPVERIINFYGRITLISLVIILDLTFFVITMTNRTHSKSFAFFETLRLLVNNPLRIKIQILSHRIFFLGVFMYFIIIQATFSGNLPSFLTKNIPRELPETLSDLLDDTVKNIYIQSTLNLDFTNPKLNKKTVPTDVVECEYVIENDTSSVCISTYIAGVKLSANDKRFHVSEESLGMIYISFIARHNWPLKNRVDFAMIKFRDIGFAHHSGQKYIENDVKKIKKRIAKSNIIFRPIKLRDLQFIFVIWTIGVTLALFIFTTELIYGPKH